MFGTEEKKKGGGEKRKGPEGLTARPAAMCEFPDKRARDEGGRASDGEGGDGVKKWRVEESESNAAVPAADAATLPKTARQRDDEESPANGVSPDEAVEERADDVEEPALFPSPSRARNTDDCGPDLNSAALSSRDPRQSATNDGRRAPHVSGAITTLYSLRQLEELFGSAPLLVDGAGAPPSSSSAASPLLPGPPGLRAGETVLVVLHHGDGDVLPQRVTGELSSCRVFCLDLSDLPPHEYQDNADSAQTSDIGGPRDAAGLLQLPATDAFLSLATQTARDIGHALRRVRALFSLDDVLSPGDAAQPETTGSDKTGDKNDTHSASVVLSCGKRENLTLPTLVMWRAAGGLLGAPTHGGDSGRNDRSTSAAGTSHGRTLQVKHLTSVDQLHSHSLLAPVYTVPHLLRAVLDAALFPPQAPPPGTRSLVYFGASWCPPCMRIVNALPAMMKEDFPPNLTCAVKADMDLATPLFEFFGVEIIPTFIIFDNDILRDAGDWDALRGSSVSEAALQRLHAGLRRSELGRIQNSQRLLVRTFIESHSGALRFDEDF